MKTVDPYVWAECFADARDSVKEHGVLSNSVVRTLALRCDITSRAFRRKFKKGKNPRTGGRRRFVIDDRRRSMIVNFGSVAQAQKYDADAPDARSITTWRRAWREIPLPERLGMTRKHGETVMRSKQVYATYVADEVNEVWQLDTLEPPLATPELLAWEALSKAERRVIPKPRLWVFVAVDDRGRLITAWEMGLVATKAIDVVSAMADAVDRWGAPRRCRWDNALAHLAGQTSLALRRLNVPDPNPVEPWQPWMKGKIEALNKILRREFFSLLPGWRGGPTSPTTEGGRVPGEGQPLSVAEIRTRFAAYVEEFNQRRPHGAIGGLTPVAYRSGELFELRAPSDAALALARLPFAVDVVVGQNGVNFAANTYVSAKLVPLGGLTVQVVRARDAGHVFVLHGGEYVCTAKDVTTLTEHDRNAIKSARDAQTDRVRRDVRAAAELRAVTAGPRVVEVPEPHTEARPQRSRRPAHYDRSQVTYTPKVSAK